MGSGVNVEGIDYRQTLASAKFYRDRGFLPLPSRMDTKRPLIRFSHLWDACPLGDIWDPAQWCHPPDLPDHPPYTTNLQVVTGRSWRLLVLDLDGQGGKDWWKTHGGPLPRTWITHSGGDGLHLWFRLPEGIRDPIVKGFLWQGPEGSHTAVERFVDRGLIMAPPSIHPGTGARYQFLEQRYSPRRLGLPAPCPQWILDAETIGQKAGPPMPPIEPAARRPAPKLTGRRWNAREVRDGIRDKFSVIRGWRALRDLEEPNGRGFAACRAIDRPDNVKSAAVHVDSGKYVDLGSGRRLDFFELAIALGIYPDFSTAVNAMGDTYVGAS